MDEDEDEDEEDAERRRADLKGGFIKGRWTREEDDKVPSFFLFVSEMCARQTCGGRMTSLR